MNTVFWDYCMNQVQRKWHHLEINYSSSQRLTIKTFKSRIATCSVKPHLRRRGEEESEVKWCKQRKSSWSRRNWGLKHSWNLRLLIHSNKSKKSRNWSKSRRLKTKLRSKPKSKISSADCTNNDTESFRSSYWKTCIKKTSACSLTKYTTHLSLSQLICESRIKETSSIWCTSWIRTGMINSSTSINGWDHLTMTAASRVP